MPPERFAPDDPRAWMNRAKSNLALASGASGFQGVFFEDLCFDCQQAAEKALKALLASKKRTIPRTHDIAHLLTLVQSAGFDIPKQILEAAKLTGYSVAARYPGLDEEVTEEEFQEAVRMAERVVNWAGAFLAG